MKSNLTRLRPRQGTLQDGLDAFASGNSLLCVELLSDVKSVEAAILRSRALIRIGDVRGAVAALDLDLADLPHELAAEALAVKALCLHILKRTEEALSVGVEARARCFSSGFATLEAELLFASAIGALLAQDLADARDCAELILSLVDDSPSWLIAKTYGYSLYFWRAKACEIRAGIELASSNYAGQVSWMSRAFQEFDKSGIRDQYSLASFVANYADAAKKLGLEEINAYALERAGSVEWVPSLALYEFRTFSALADSASVAGDHLGALRFFRRCLDCAPNAPLQIRASLERARLLREIGESFSSREELDHALRLSRSVNWEQVGSLNQRQLVLLAGQIAHFDPKQAEKLVLRYDGLTRNTADGVAVQDEAFRGQELLARAAVLKAFGKTDRAILILIDALNIFICAKLSFEVASVARELADLTEEPYYAEVARLHAARLPQCVASRRSKSAIVGSSVESITPTAQARLSNIVAFPRPNLTSLS